GDYVYVAGDATRCYQHGGRDGLPEKCRLVTRQIVFLIPNHFVVFDRAETTDASYRKDWLIHTAHTPAVSGKIIRADHGEGRLFCRTLLPADATLTSVGGPGKEFWAAGRNWNIVADGLKGESLALMGQWRVEVTPAGPRKSDVFLHVIQVGDRRLEAMDETRLLKTRNTCGVRLTADSGTWEVTFNSTGELGGHVKRSGGSRSIDSRLATVVQQQTGISTHAPGKPLD
ncbi:MAG: hypothetical protein ACYTBS_02545, partial [Planctomycetota bacterium]